MILELKKLFHGKWVVILLFAWIVTLAPLPVWAISSCGIGLMEGSDIEVDGFMDAGEWSDASTLNSSDPCFENLDDLDAPGSSTVVSRNVTIKSKRFLRDATWYYGFFFEVEDVTTSGPTLCSGSLCLGERIILQFNPDINGDEQLQSEDRYLEIKHFWAGTGQEITDGLLNFYGSVNDPGCALPKWNFTSSLPTTGINYALRKPGGKYNLEIEIPAALVGNPSGTDDIGLAVAVINDFGMDLVTLDFDCSGGSVCTGSGASFPSAMVTTNTQNPVDAECLAGWTVPDDWGVGYAATPPADVTILRTPDFWNSSAIEVFECDDSGYRYYPDFPCRIRIEATVDNAGAAASRNILFLWADHGTGDPLAYRFVDLKRITIPGDHLTVSSDEFSVPAGLTNHPCLRVYILPDPLDSTFDVTQSIQTKADVDAWEAHYAIGDHHWAQKNIHIHTTLTECPDFDCRIEANLKPQKQHFASDTGTNHVKTFTFGPTAVFAQTAAPGSKPMNISLSPKDWKRYGNDHVILEARAYGFSESSVKPRYNFIEPLGGVIHMFPLEMVNKKAEIPFQFKVFNGSSVKKTILIQTRHYLPEAVGDLNISIDDKQQQFILGPGEQETVTGRVMKPERNDVPPVWILGLVIFIIALVFMVMIMKSKSR